VPTPAVRTTPSCRDAPPACTPKDGERLMDVTTINMRGCAIARCWVGTAVAVRFDNHYPPIPARTFEAVVQAVYPRGVVVRRASGYADFVSFTDLFTGHVRVLGHLGSHLERAWHPSWVLDEAAG
jgi:hypothetical protein